MPHVNPTIMSPVDEIKVYQDEGEEEEKSSAENLKEVKNSLVTEEEEKASHVRYISPKNVPPSDERRPNDPSSLVPTGRRYDYLSPPFGYVAYAHPNAAALSMVNRVPLVPANHAPLSLMQVYNGDFQPPPAHMGLPFHIDPKSGARTPVYHTLHSANQYPPPVFSPDFTHQFPWPHHPMYSFSPGFRSPYPSPFSPPNHLPNKFPSPSLAPTHSMLLPGLSHPLVRPKVEMAKVSESRSLTELKPIQRNSHSLNSLPHHNNTIANSQLESSVNERAHNDKKSHIKKPLNAFMLFMREQRATVVSECTLKESAAINQLLGKKWHNLSKDEQSKYYEMAKAEREIHMQRYPGWTARDNYAINAKRKKRKRDKSQEGDANNPKKCRARFGLEQQNNWCKPCRRKKKCIRYLSGSDNAGESEDNIGSVDSLEVPTPDSRFDEDTNLSDNDSGNGDVDDELEVSSEFSLSSPPVPRPSCDPLESPSQLLQQQLPLPSGCLLSPDTPPSTDSSIALVT